ncbi:MAG: MoxR family ATPase [Myxococcota bacterium]|nr:MoxR family ATPase [Myxococcota bacterium]
MEQGISAINDEVRQHSAFIDDVIREVSRVIVGQRLMVERMLMGMLTGGHILLEGVPGLAKTLTVNSLAQTIDADFHRIQFTPDLLPADILGTMIYNAKTAEFSVKKGPIFAHLILADEINRAPAKVQSALLEAMQERQVTIGPDTYQLPDPFICMATQNPIEQEGTYQLPEAQVDRFMFKVKVGYPTRDEELEIMNRQTEGQKQVPTSVVDPTRITAARDVVRKVYIDEKLKQYIVNLVFATRDPQSFGLGRLSDLIGFGASPRASIALNMAARAHAFMQHRGYVIPEDIKAVGMDVLRHRVLLTYEAEAEELTSEQLVQQIFDAVDIP